MRWKRGFWCRLCLSRGICRFRLRDKGNRRGRTGREREKGEGKGERERKKVMSVGFGSVRLRY